MNHRTFTVAVRLIGGNWRDKHGNWAKSGFKGRVNRVKEWMRYQVAKRRYTA